MSYEKLKGLRARKFDKTTRDSYLTLFLKASKNLMVVEPTKIKVVSNKIRRQKT